MLYYSLGNYYSNNKNKIYFYNLLLISKKKIYFKINKKEKQFLNIKQIIYFLFNENYWKNINFKNLIIHITFIKNKVQSNIDGIVKLYILSKGIKKNNCLNLSLIFEKLVTIIWTNIGNFELDSFYKYFLNNYFLSSIIIESIDKFPYLTKFLIPKNVRISNTNRIRLGSFLSKGVTVMSEGYVNFNTFIEQNCMIEGRVSAGVYISKNTDLGGSCSIMGTLSGGGNTIISIGENCLLGANSGLGISLGNNCIIESGLYITSGTKISLLLKDKFVIVKAKKLSFLNNLIFYRNSITGKVECVKNMLKEIKINKILHKN